jgi:hypothetical protein
MDLIQGSDRRAESFPDCADRVVVASAEGGDRLIRLLAGRPRRLVIVDRSAAQLRLAELKLAALRELDFAEYLEFTGLRASERRRLLYRRVRTRLPVESDEFWLARLSTIDRGVATQGRLERRLSSFQAFAALIHGRGPLDRFRALATESDRRAMLDREWKTCFWRRLGIFLWGRWFDVPPGRLERLLLEGRLFAPPPEPAPADFASAKESCSRALVAGDPADALPALPARSVDLFALGCLDLEGLQADLIRAAAPGARVLVVARSVPDLGNARFDAPGRDAGFDPGLLFVGEIPA